MRTQGLALALVLACATVFSCRSARAPAAQEAAWERESPLRPLPALPLGLPFDLSRAQVALSPEKVRLGRWLFFDARLSVDGTVSCATCHDPGYAFSEPRPRSRGVGGRTGARRAQPIANVAFGPSPALFWDGRASSLAEQAQGPITNPVEMANTLEGAVGTIAAIPGYRRAFRAAYGDDRVDAPRLTDAIAAYEATRLSGDSAYDRFEAGDDAALTPDALEGRDLFFGRGRCNACHLGPTFTDGRFHNVGIGYQQPADAIRHGFSDVGRYGVTRDPADMGAFKTPTLRDVARRPPYMHDGSSPDLADAVFRYVAVNENPWLDPLMREVRIMPVDVPPLVAFLRALDGAGFEDEAPRSFPR